LRGAEARSGDEAVMGGFLPGLLIVTRPDVRSGPAHRRRN